MQMRVLVLGAEGQVGHELMGSIAPFADVIGATHQDADLLDPAGLRRAIGHAAPDAIVNAASYNDVDRAEREPAAAMRANAEAVALLGQEARRRHAALVHYSTNFVFDGKKVEPYVESDAAEPLGQYGRSKLAGEQVLMDLGAPAIVMRTSWVYSLRRYSFVSSVLRLARQREALRMVSDQVANPTFCRDLAQATALLLFGARGRLFETFDEARGVYHVAGEGGTSRYELAKAAIELDPARAEHKVRSLDPIASSEFPAPAARPSQATLDCSRFAERFGIRLPPWRESLERALGDWPVGVWTTSEGRR